MELKEELHYFIFNVRFWFVSRASVPNYNQNRARGPNQSGGGDGSNDIASIDALAMAFACVSRDFERLQMNALTGTSLLVHEKLQSIPSEFYRQLSCTQKRRLFKRKKRLNTELETIRNQRNAILQQATRHANSNQQRQKKAALRHYHNTRQTPKISFTPPQRPAHNQSKECCEPAVRQQDISLSEQVRKIRKQNGIVQDPEDEPTAIWLI